MISLNALVRTPNGTGVRREIELDFLRGIAILAVVDYHNVVNVLAYPLLKLGFPPLGWVGVNLFFVLSGFLVGGLLIKEWRMWGAINYKRFLVRRGFKIWPSYYFFILILLLSGHQSLWTMWPALVHLQNYLPVFPIHLWSLAVEEHAYLLLLLLLIVAARHGVGMRTLLVWLGIMCVTAVSIRMLMVALSWNYIYTTHTRVEAILYGVILAAIFHCRPAWFSRMQSWRALWIGLLVLALLFFRVGFSQKWASSAAFDFADLIGVCMLMLVYRHQPKERSLPYRFVAWIGLYSYGIYLWHVSTSGVVAKVGRYLPSQFVSSWTVVAQPLTGIALGIVMTKLIEFPALRLRERWFPTKVLSPVEPDTRQSGTVNSAAPNATLDWTKPIVENVLP